MKVACPTCAALVAALLVTTAITGFDFGAYTIIAMVLFVVTVLAS